MRVLEMGDHRLIEGDCYRVLPTLELYDIIVTSPQYNIDINYGVTSDSLPWEAYRRQMQDYAALLRGVLAPGGSLFLVVGHSCRQPWVAHDVANAFRSQWVLQNRIVWVKSVSVGMRSFGHFKPINSRRFVNGLYEEVLHFTVDGDVELDRLAVGVPYEDKSNICRWQGNTGDLRCRGDVWFIPYKTITSRAERGGHPATFPVELAKNCIRLHGVEKKPLVLDPMMGTGSTLVAADYLGLQATGVDICFDYVQTAAARLLSQQDST